MRTLKVWTALIGGLLAFVGLIGFGWLRSSLPDLDGTVILSGPTADITIARDSHGVPHIGAANDRDLYFGMGYAHAQDRLWQMEMNRRIGHGRVAEVLGEAGLGFDRYFRTLGFGRKAEAALAQLPAEGIAALEAYAAGVNAYLAHHGGALPPEFLLAGVKPEPWRPVDTLVWQKLMWLDLSGNMRKELARAELLTKLTPVQVSALYPAYPGDAAISLPDLAAVYAESAVADLAALVGRPRPEGYGSNNWVVSGDHTKSGKPLLANDPHLGLTTPSIWYLVRLHNRTTGANLVGASFPGTPSVVLGRNDRIAWGFTNTEPDSQDLFVEKLVDGGTRYLTPDGPADFVLRREIIRVKGADDVVLNVRETRHGPVLSDALPEHPAYLRDGYVLALQWTALQDRETAMLGLMGLGKARNFEDFKAAGLHYMGPEQNMVYADVDGNIGYYAPALVPVRKPENTIGGRLPSPGWIADYDWQGFIPYAELPTRFNPEGGIIATANEKVIDADYPHFITGDWALPYRGNRIRHLLAARDDHDIQSFVQIQQDTVSDMMRDVLPELLWAIKEDNAIVEMLGAWDGTMAADRPEPLIAQTWLRLYQEALMADELGALYEDYRSIRPQLLKSGVYWDIRSFWKVGAPAGIETDYYTLPPLDEQTARPWCDNITTDQQETCFELASETYRKTIELLRARYGRDWEKWKWGDAHILHQAHRPMSQVAPLRPLFELSTPVPGDINSINVAGVSQSSKNLFGSTFGPSYRGIFDLNDLDQSLYVQPTGQSGNPLSPHYADLFDDWLAGRYFRIPTGKAVPDDTEHLLVIRAAPAERP